MTTQSNTTGTPPPPAGFWKLRHAVIGLGVLALFVVLMLRACGNDDPQQQASEDDEVPRQAIVVQIPASQWPQAQQQARQALPQAQQQPLQQRYEYVPQQGYGYAPPPPPVAPPPAPDTGNPWAVQQPQSYGAGQQSQQWGGTQQKWGSPQLNRPQYVQPPAQSQYRPLEQPAATTAKPQRTVPQAPAATGYWPSAPYDRLSGSSFGAPVYPYGYGGGVPGHYGTPGAYPAPGGVYAPGWPSARPGFW